MNATIEFTEKQMEQVLNEVRNSRPEEEGTFYFEIDTTGFYISVEGDLHITYNEYHASNWQEEGYNDYCEEAGRSILGLEITIAPKFDIYDNAMDNVVLRLTDEQEERIVNEIEKVA